MQETGKMDICSRLLKIEWQASSQADLLTETDPVRLPNVSATWLGRGDRGNAGNSDLQRRISAKTCQAAFLQSHRPWL